MFRGKPHSSADPKEHVSMVLYDGKDDRITSVHVYGDGTGKFSKQKYNWATQGILACGLVSLEILVKKAKRFERLLLGCVMA
jgi:hypothetical protein